MIEFFQTNGVPLLVVLSMLVVIAVGLRGGEGSCGMPTTTTIQRVADPEQIGESVMIESVTWIVDIVVGIVRGALGIPSARRPAMAYVLAYGVIPRRTPARRMRNE